MRGWKAVLVKMFREVGFYGGGCNSRIEEIVLYRSGGGSFSCKSKVFGMERSLVCLKDRG